MPSSLACQRATADWRISGELEGLKVLAMTYTLDHALRTEPCQPKVRHLQPHLTVLGDEDEYVAGFKIPMGHPTSMDVLLT